MKHPSLSGVFRGVVISGLAIAALFSGITCTALAGDLLRGGGFTAPGTGSSVPGSFTPPSAIQAQQNAQDVFARTTRAIQAVTAMQNTARQIAIAAGNNLGIANPNKTSQNLPAVTDGLSTAGLYPTGGISQLPAGWTGVKSLAQTQAAGQTTVTVTQNSADAVLTWQSFNVGKNTTLDFDQSAGGAEESRWIAFNIIRDPSLAPSQILGSIQAGGQVYVINQNGIIFGGASQVNVHTLVASSLPINTTLVTQGLLDNPQEDFLFSALLPASSGGAPSLLPNGADGDVIVEPGAVLAAPTTPDHVGGRIALVGPNVDNEGTIATPDGQTILAAGLQVGFAASSDTTLRGLDVYVGDVASSSYDGPAAGTATNDGLIDSPRGDTYITGKTVDQLGVIASTTSVTLNGRIDLSADYGAVPNPTTSTASSGASAVPFIFHDTGEVELGPNSVNDILPELNSTETVVGAQLAIPSTVLIQGQVIHFAQDSTLLAPNANVTVGAGFWTDGVFLNYSTAASSPQVYMDSGAIIDAAGSADVDASVTENIVAVQLRGAELADDPLQRFGVFRGQTIYIDIRQQGVYDGVAWIGTPLADTSGYVGLVERGVGELTVNGGNVTISAGGSVVMQRGSEVNVSGGYINYSGGVVDTTKVLSNGHIYDISQATPDMVYDGIYTGQFTADYIRYGLSDTYTNPISPGGVYQDGYVYGGNGGTLDITAPSMALDGKLVGVTATGPRQLQLQPAPSSLALAFSAQSPTIADFPADYPTPPTVLIEAGASLKPVGAFTLNSSGNPEPLPADRSSEVILSPDLTSDDGFGTFSINDSDGKIIVPSSTSWNGPAAIFTNPTTQALSDGSITLLAANLTVDGSITLPGGNLSFSVYDISPFTLAQSPEQASTPYTSTRGNFVLGDGAVLDTAGLLVDNRLESSQPETLPLVDAGGSVTIATSNADLLDGSLIDVSGGVEVSPTGSISYGNGGTIKISTGKAVSATAILGGKLNLEGTLEGYSGATGGTLSLAAPLVRIGSAAAAPESLVLSPDFFSEGGFASFSITGIAEPTANPAVYLAGLVIAPGTVIDPIAENHILESPAVAGDTLTLVPEVLPQQSRSPVNLSFTASGTGGDGSPGHPALVARGDLIVGAGAVVESDPGGDAGASISFKGDTVTILGSVIAPGGSISLTGASSGFSIYLTPSGSAPMTTIELGPQSVLSTAGTVVPTANAYGYTTGYVLNGGQITMNGNIVVEGGALLNVSGARDVLDLSPAYTNVDFSGATSLAGMVLVPTEVESNGGMITLKGAQGLFFDGTIEGSAGGSAALGGSLVVSSGAFIPPSDTAGLPLNTPTLDVTQTPVAFHTSGSISGGQVVLGSNGKPLPGLGYFAATSFENSGLDFLNLNGSVEFTGSKPVDLETNGSLTVATGGFIYADTPVRLQAPYVDLGLAFTGPLTPTEIQGQIGTGFVPGGAFYATLQSGNENFTVVANLIDIGNLVLQGVANANFIADGGDIRGDGTLDTMGNILMRAGQIYPPTEDIFNIISYGGSVKFESSGVRDTPLSAGGVLNVYASTIIQDGVLRAPLGQINLGWNGSGSSPDDPLTGAGYVTGRSVPIAQQVTLGAGSITSVSAIDPVTGQALIIPYGVNQNGNAWIDPSGTDITAGGLPQKSITISGKNVTDAKGATIDIRGGGDLLAYEFVSGVGGTEDILASTPNSSGQVTSDSFAVIPGYQADFAPDGAYNTSAGNGDVYNSSNTISDYGYTNSTLSGIGVGEQVYLGASTDGLAAGAYTLLPARYALLSGAFLVTLRPGAVPTGSVQNPDGSSLVSGYVLHSFDQGQTGQPLAQSFEVDNQAVIANDAEYNLAYGNSFLAISAIKNNQPVPALPKDGGHLIINANQTLVLAGEVEAQVPSDGRGALVDISTNNPNGILIAGPGATGASGQLVLDASSLDALGAGSLLIGGLRTGSDESALDVTTSDIEVDNAGDPLTGSDIILAATGGITLGDGAIIESSGQGSGGDVTVQGNGALIRVSTNPALTVTRTGVTSGNTASLVIGNNSTLHGGSLTLDSSQSTTFGTNVSLRGQSLALSSGHIILDLSGAAPTDGLVLSGQLLQTLSNGARSFSLLSYQSIDIYGSGQIGALDKDGQPLLGNLALHAGAINGFGAGDVTFAAQNILLDNEADSSTTAGSASSGGTLTFDGGTISLGANQLYIGQYATVTLNASAGVIQTVSGGLEATGDLDTTAPVITAARDVTGSITAGGALSIQSPAKSDASMTGGDGATLTFTAASIDENSLIAAHGGVVNMDALTGDMDLGSAASIDVTGISQAFFDETEYIGGGQVVLTANAGNVNIAAPAKTGQVAVNVSADSGGGSAGTLTVSAANGQFTLDGNLAGNAGAGGQGGSFSLDVGALGELEPVDTVLNKAGFNQSLTFRVRNTPDVSVSGIVDAAVFQLSVDQGDIDIIGAIHADGATGGTVMLQASGNLTLESGATISAVGENFNSAGQGGSVSLETTGGMITIAAGSTIDLAVKAAPSGPGALQDVSGTLYLQAPQVDANGNVIAVNGNAAAGVDLDIAPIAGTITGASSIIAAGSYVQDAQTTGVASIDTYDADGNLEADSMEGVALANAGSFMSAATAGSVTSRLIDGNSSISAAIFNLEPAEQIENSLGSLILNVDWDLSTARYGPTKTVTDLFGDQIAVGVEPGVVTLRAAGNIVFNGSLSDGFGDGTGAADEPYDNNGNPELWMETLLPRFSDGTSQRSWSYNITAGADFSAVNPLQTVPLSTLSSNVGSVMIGYTDRNGENRSFDGTIDGAINPLTTPILPNGDNQNFYQVIRTGAGSINVAAGRDVQLLNQFATIYTAGTQVADTPAESALEASFDVPQLFATSLQKQLGNSLYPAQYSYEGGDVNVSAGGDIIHLYQAGNGTFQNDSEAETPNNWLYRRGDFDPLTGEFDNTVWGDNSSTTWWVDFSNFFEGIGALGGGNVSLVAGRSVMNVDAVVPTNARMPKGAPSAANLVQLGGGNLLVQAGGDISGGIYYVEQGQGVLEAGGQITTNSTRSPSLSFFTGAPLFSQQDWLPTTLFLGDGSFDVSAAGNVLLGPVVNPFLLPSGVDNTIWDKSYFSTYDPSDAVDVASYGGSVTLREEATTSNEGQYLPILELWYDNEMLGSTTPSTGAYFQPWLTSVEDAMQPFATEFGLMPGTLSVAAFGGDINVVGNIELSPASRGTVDMLAAGAINGLQPTGVQRQGASSNQVWGTSQIALSDAAPDSIYGVTTPFGAQGDPDTSPEVLALLAEIFTDSGSTTGQFSVFQTQELLHAKGLLHLGDPNPVHLYAAGGSISGVTLLSPKDSRVIASSDITNIALYIQNVSTSDISMVSAGRDILAYDAESPLQIEAMSSGNTAPRPLAGDIQISGPGALEVLAGRDLTLGTGAENANGTGVGITSIGNARNPYLPFDGASVIAAAGLGGVAVGLDDSTLDFKAFISQFIESSMGSQYFADLAASDPDLDVSTLAEFKKLSKDPEQQAVVALDIFYLVLRDAGRDHNILGSPGFGSYTAGLAAISALFPVQASGDIDLTSREIKTESGGDIDILDPSGQLTVGIELPGGQPVDQGILTEDGGNISIFTQGSVNVGTSRIFTLRGGNEIIWSSGGNIGAGASAKTVQSAPPTRVLVDPQSGDVETDLAGLATGGGIGVLATVVGVPPGSVDLIAPTGTIDAGDAGIRATGNINLAAVQVLNASNISAGGSSAGVPVVSVAAPNLGAITAASASAGAGAQAANQQANNTTQTQPDESDQPSIIDVEVLGYGGGDDDDSQGG